MSDSSVEVTRRFFGVEDGKVYPRMIEVGETVTSELATAAIAGGHAAEQGPPELAAKHVGNGKWFLVRGAERVLGPFDSKEAAEAAR